MCTRKVLLTFDLEEFDIPVEYGLDIGWQEQLEVGRLGMQMVSQVLSLHNIPVTIFTTAAYAVENREQVKTLSQQHEIASHTYYHSKFTDSDLLLSRITLEEITGKNIYGLRMPRMRPIDMAVVRRSGYLYDSSVNPTFLPGKYNHLRSPRTLHIEQGVYRFPASVSPTLRIPLFWLAFKNLPYTLYKQLAVNALKNYGYLNLYFHPWEFTDLKNYRLPGYVKRHSGDPLLERLHQFIKDLKKESSFETIHDYLQQRLHQKETIPEYG